MALCLIMCLFTANAFAQEVRGLEIKWVKELCRDKYGEYDAYNVKVSNRNSIPVSVTLELWRKGYVQDRYPYNQIPESLEKTKDIVLDPNEDYVWKIEIGVSYKDNYIVKYKAYKLQ